MDPDVALAICRFGHDAATMILWGAFAFLWALVPEDLAGKLGRRLEPLRTIAILIAVATTLAALPLEAGAIGNGWEDALDGQTLRAVLFETSVGAAWVVQATAALLLAATIHLAGRLSLAATAITSALLLASVALTGHAAMQEGGFGLAHRVNDAMHVLAGGAWLGALVPLLPLLSALDDPETSHEAATALRRFSTAGYGAVALVIATGSLNTLLVLHRWPTNGSSPYQALLACKIALVLFMTALAMVNRYVYVPKMARARARAVRALRQATIAEIGLGLVVIGLVSVFGLLEPA